MQGVSRHRAAPGRAAVLGVAGLLLLSAPLFAVGATARELNANVAQLAADQRAISLLQVRVKSLEAQAATVPDWGSIARTVQASVFTVDTKHGLGSGWVARAGSDGSDVVTNFHVVAEAWNAADAKVQLRQGDRVMDGTIVSVRPGDDLAIVHIADRLPALQAAGQRPPLGETVLAVGSPLGLGGSVSLGVVSGYRSLDGGDYLQFSAPVSPGNSGGPVLDRYGRVVAMTSAKFEGEGVEALALGIPVATICSTVVTCGGLKP